MKTAMQELRDDLVKSLETGNEALNEIIDEKLREICQKVAQLTLESIIKRIDEELLEMEKQQIKSARHNGRQDLRDNGAMYKEDEQYYNNTFKQEEQTEL
jgi:glutamyl-tRNA reductase